MKEPAADARDTRPGGVARLLHLCPLGLKGAVPDHSTFSKNRRGLLRESELLRKVFETTVRRWITEGLVGGEGFAVDASMIKADANRQRSVPGSEWQAPEAANHAVREYLAVLDDAAFGAATPVVPKFISLACGPSGWRPMPPTVRPRTSLGWCLSAVSSRTSRCSINLSARHVLA